MSDRDRAILVQMGDALARMRRYIGTRTRDEFVADEMVVDAVVRTLEIVSEASRRLSEEFKTKYQDVPWQQIAGAGNVYRHDYEKVSPELIYATATREVESLRDVLRAEDVGLAG